MILIFEVDFVTAGVLLFKAVVIFKFNFMEVLIYFKFSSFLRLSSSFRWSSIVEVNFVPRMSSCLRLSLFLKN